MNDLFQPGFGAYLHYYVGFALRYLVLAGGVTWLLHVTLRQKAFAYRIQEAFPSLREMAGEVRWSLTNAVCTGLSTMLMFRLIRDGHSRMYMDIDEYGLAYLAASVVAGILGYDAWFYWQHRLLHTSWLYRRVHSVHHRSTNPTPLAGFAHHPVETFLGNTFFVLFVLLVPIHPLALGAIGAVFFGVALHVHLGYEFFPRWTLRSPLLGELVTATHHNMHHSSVGGNYGLVFQYWDRLMGTQHSLYSETLDAVTARRGAVLSERACLSDAPR